ncbi:hypothetical protein POKO110462_07045 [Pontibacter korlensis]
MVHLNTSINLLKLSTRINMSYNKTQAFGNSHAISQME